FTDPSSSGIYTLSLHDALPISGYFLYDVSESTSALRALFKAPAKAAVLCGNYFRPTSSRRFDLPSCTPFVKRGRRRVREREGKRERKEARLASQISRR